MIKRKAYIASILIALLTVSAFSPLSYAQKRAKLANEEDIAIAFYKTAETIPNLERWIKKRAPYINTPWALQDKVYDAEKNRLTLAYRSFTPQKDFLVINTKTNIKLTAEADEEGHNKYYLNASFKNAPEAVYFPYEFLGERIVLVPYDLEDFMRHEITVGDFHHISSNRFDDETLDTILRMRTHKADTNQPYKIDGMEQWAMSTKIATIEFWAPNRRLVYEYSTSDYVSPHALDLQDIYKKPFEGSDIPKGITKPVPNLSREE